MLAETPTSLAEKRRTMGYLNFSAIDRWFHEQTRMLERDDGTWRYLHGLSDEAVADLLKDKVPEIKAEWVATVRRKNGWRLYQKDRHWRGVAVEEGDLKQRVTVLEDNFARALQQLDETSKRLDKLWGALM
jgi:hypothetical protein